MPFESAFQRPSGLSAADGSPSDTYRQVPHLACSSRDEPRLTAIRAPSPHIASQRPERVSTRLTAFDTNHEKPRPARAGDAARLDEKRNRSKT